MIQASSVGVDTIPRQKATGSGSKNKPASRYWHQGFGVIKCGRRDAVPFATQATAIRIAEQAAENLNKTRKKKNVKMIVRKHREVWVYYQKKD